MKSRAFTPAASASTGPAKQSRRRVFGYAMAAALALGSLTGTTVVGATAHAAAPPTVPAEPFIWTIGPEGGFFPGLSTSYIANMQCTGSSTVEQNRSDTGNTVTGKSTLTCTAFKGSEADPYVGEPVNVRVASRTELYAWNGTTWPKVATGPEVVGTNSVTSEVTYTDTGGLRAFLSAGFSAASAAGLTFGGNAAGTVTGPNYMSRSAAQLLAICDPNSGDLVTIIDIKSMFGNTYDTPVVRAGLPSLNAVMKAKGINTPRRCAAFLATLLHESGLAYNAGQGGKSGYDKGRGFIQLTTRNNYKMAKAGLGHDFIAAPGDAATLEWSAKVAGWYWVDSTRPLNAAADNLDMGLVAKHIGYWQDPNLPPGDEDNARCADFKKALAYITAPQALPDGIICRKHK